MGDDLVKSIQGRLEIVKDQIAEAARKANRDPDHIRLIVVTKAQPFEVVKAAVCAGAKLLGENYAEEAFEKIIALRTNSEVEWHMIGHVQSRKSELVASHFSMLHALDSLKLAMKLDRILGETNKRLPVLLEFNVGGEESKYGWQASEPDEWPRFMPEIEKILELPHLDVRGLMTMPPYFDESEKARPYFSKLRNLRDHLGSRFTNQSWQELSMGTSSDYKIAIEEGATYVRVGQAILGKRTQKQGPLL
jgi:pyridoxal phosphate enzyme (YggS family)